MVMLAARTPEFETCDLSSLRRLAFGSLPSIDLLRRLRWRTDAAFSVSYGITEASGGALTVTSEGADLAEVSTSIGTPLPGIEWKLVGPEGTLTPPGVPGELLVRDECLFLGYLNRPEATRAALDPEGWLRTGDAVSAQPDGSLRMVGRLKEMFKSGGYNVYPTEIETALVSHDGVAAVAVVEAPDRLWGEVGVAFVQARPGVRLEPEQLRVHAHASLANYKVPKRFVVLDRLPLLVNGKPDRRLLRTEARRFADVELDS
jgi:acyl-CoA synthetase (AMP-forming)/AMP-acid ligase II